MEKRAPAFQNFPSGTIIIHYSTIDLLIVQEERHWSHKLGLSYKLRTLPWSHLALQDRGDAPNSSAAKLVHFCLSFGTEGIRVNTGSPWVTTGHLMTIQSFDVFGKCYNLALKLWLPNHPCGCVIAFWQSQPACIYNGCSVPWSYVLILWLVFPFSSKKWPLAKLYSDLQYDHVIHLTTIWFA